MKYKNFDEWFNAHPDKDSFHYTAIEAMRDAWDGAVNNYEQNAVIGNKIRELLNTLNDAKKIDCTCDKNPKYDGLTCLCQRGDAIHRAGIELGKYLRKIRKELE